MVIYPLGIYEHIRSPLFIILSIVAVQVFMELARDGKKRKICRRSNEVCRFNKPWGIIIRQYLEFRV